MWTAQNPDSAAADLANAASTNANADTTSNNSGSSSSTSTTYYIDALRDEYHYQWGSNTPGSAVTITYSFLTSVPNYYSASAPENQSFAPMTGAQEDVVRAVLQMYSAVANVHFVEVSGTGSIAFGTAALGTGVGGSAFYPYPAYNGPSDGTAFGDVWITNQYPQYADPTVGTNAYSTFIHEIGHALGMKHPGNYDASDGGTPGPYLPASEDSQQYTVMSYYGGPNGSSTPVTPQLYDIATMQFLYGANMSWHTGDDTYTFSTSVQVETIWDAGGNDTFDASNQLHAVSIDLHPGSFSSIAGNDNVAIAFGAVIEAALGSNYNDTLTASDTGSTLHGGPGDDTLVGGAGNDVLVGGAGSDTLTGGGGGDHFVFDAAQPSNDVDVIRDFDHGGQAAFNAAEGDVLDLSALLSAQHAGGQDASMLVRAVEDATGHSALLQIDPDGAGSAFGWTTVAWLDGVDTGDGIAVVLDSGGAPVTVVVAAADASTPPGEPQDPAGPQAGTPPSDGVIYAHDGGDQIGGGPGDDTIVGGNGDDLIGGNGGNDTITGGAGNDMLGGDKGNDHLDGGIGNDTLFGGAGDDELHGSAGDDIIVGNDGNDMITGDDGNDIANGGAGNDVMSGGAGNDILGGGADDDVITGDDGDDQLWGEDGKDVLDGGTGNDSVAGGAGDDQLHGGDGNDIVVGDDGNDLMFGDAGNDRMNGGAGDDTVNGGDGNDEVGGGAGNDTVNGGAGNDTLWGEDGNDTLNGGTGNDILLGGAGSDTFVFASGDGSDVIADFTSGEDRISFAATNLHSLADVQSHASFNSVTNTTTITYDGGSLTLNSVTLSHLTAGDFIFS